MEKTKKSEITHLCFRIIHRIVKTCFDLWGSLKKVHTFELTCFRAATESGVGIPDWVDLFLTSCTIIQAITSGNLFCGGMITLIAEYLHMLPSVTVRPLSIHETWLDTRGLIRLGMLKETPKGYYWLYGEQRKEYMKLPRINGQVIPHGPNAYDYYCHADQEDGPQLNMEIIQLSMRVAVLEEQIKELREGGPNFQYSDDEWIYKEKSDSGESEDSHNYDTP